MMQQAVRNECINCRTFTSHESCNATILYNSMNEPHMIQYNNDPDMLSETCIFVNFWGFQKKRHIKHFETWKYSDVLVKTQSSDSLPIDDSETQECHDMICNDCIGYLFKKNQLYGCSNDGKCIWMCQQCHNHNPGSDHRVDFTNGSIQDTFTRFGPAHGGLMDDYSAEPIYIIHTIPRVYHLYTAGARQFVIMRINPQNHPTYDLDIYYPDGSVPTIEHQRGSNSCYECTMQAIIDKKLITIEEFMNKYNVKITKPQMVQTHLELLNAHHDCLQEFVGEVDRYKAGGEITECSILAGIDHIEKFDPLAPLTEDSVYFKKYADLNPIEKLLVDVELQQIQTKYDTTYQRRLSELTEFKAHIEILKAHEELNKDIKSFDKTHLKKVLDHQVPK
jgi:hypothetical protein